MPRHTPTPLRSAHLLAVLLAALLSGAVHCFPAYADGGHPHAPAQAGHPHPPHEHGTPCAPAVPLPAAAGSTGSAPPDSPAPSCSGPAGDGPGPAAGPRPAGTAPAPHTGTVRSTLARYCRWLL
ncbi:hypothetical protein [Streptomyces sp. NPDC012888]|uniref:hypothetical protein n=1 Tax=Streptomyces sp. NPDC012888 TaxID=3364855 RepID=UPI0036B4C6C4